MKTSHRKILMWSAVAIFIPIFLLFYSIFLGLGLFLLAHENNFNASSLEKDEFQHFFTDFYSVISEKDIGEMQEFFLEDKLKYRIYGDDEIENGHPNYFTDFNYFPDQYSDFKDRHGILSNFSITSAEYNSLVYEGISSIYFVYVDIEYPNRKTSDRFSMKKTKDGFKISIWDISIQD